MPFRRWGISSHFLRPSKIWRSLPCFLSDLIIKLFPNLSYPAENVKTFCWLQWLSKQCLEANNFQNAVFKTYPFCRIGGFTSAWKCRQYDGLRLYMWLRHALGVRKKSLAPCHSHAILPGVGEAHGGLALHVHPGTGDGALILADQATVDHSNETGERWQEEAGDQSVNQNHWEKKSISFHF